MDELRAAKRAGNVRRVRELKAGAEVTTPQEPEETGTIVVDEPETEVEQEAAPATETATTDSPEVGSTEGEEIA